MTAAFAWHVVDAVVRRFRRRRRRTIRLEACEELMPLPETRYVCKVPFKWKVHFEPTPDNHAIVQDNKASLAGI